MNRSVIWLGVPDETFPGPHIPTEGYATSASDLFRVVGIFQTGHEGWNSCYTDVDTCAGLARVIEGEIQTLGDLEAAETALQILLWHDRVDVMIPGFRVQGPSGGMYIRCQPERSRLAVELFKTCVPYDQIFAVEEVEAVEFDIVKSSLANSCLLGRRLSETGAAYLSECEAQAVALSSLPVHMGVPAYYSSPHLSPFPGKRGFFGEFYDAVSKGWRETVEVVPDVELAVLLPPLLSIVLDRAPNRDKIPETILELREETVPVRRELVGFTDIVRGARNQQDIENRCREIRESFRAVVPASRKRQASVLLPLLKCYKAARSPLDLLIKALNPDYTPDDPRLIVNRTVTAKMFSHLLVTDSMHSMLSYFFTPTELSNLEHSLEHRRRS